eukprot:165108-Chlamydomonas_euryale.AAC.1
MHLPLRGDGAPTPPVHLPYLCNWPRAAMALLPHSSMRSGRCRSSSSSGNQCTTKLALSVGVK